MIQIGHHMIPCRKCRAAFGDDCTVTRSEVKDAPIVAISVGRTRNNPHKIRVRDARRVSELLDL